MALTDFEVLEKMFDAYNRGDFEQGAAMLHEDAELHQWGAIPDSEVYTGRDEFVRGIVRWSESFAPGIQYRPEEMVDAGDRVLVRVLLAGQGRESGVELSQTIWQVWEIREERAFRCWVYDDEAAAREAVGLTAR